MSKRIIYTFALCIGFLFGMGLSTSQAQATKSQPQEIGYVNPQSILHKMPEFKAVQQRMQNYQQKKQQQIQQQIDTLRQKISNYQKRQSVMSSTAKKSAQQRLGKMRSNLQKAEQQARQDIQQKRQHLISPLMQQIHQSIQKVAKQMNLAYVINTTTTNGDMIVLYASNSAQNKYDITNKVMNDLGIGQ